MKWSRNNAACYETWFALKLLEQLRRPFKTAGELKMTELLFFDKEASDSDLKGAASTLAKQIYNVFTTVQDATLETGKKKSGAISAMGKVLSDGEETVAALADVADDHFLFVLEAEEGEDE